MQSKRDGLIPIGEALADLPGPVQALIPLAPNTTPLNPLRPSEPACFGQRSGTGSRFHGADDGVVLASPHQPRQSPPVQARQRAVQAHHVLKRRDQTPLWQLSPACCWPGFALKRCGTQSRELILGKSLSEFMKTLGVYTTDGKAHTRLRNQMKRLFHAQVEFIYKDGLAEQFIASRVADRGEFWWDPSYLFQGFLTAR